jgi:glyoxylate/hydroxypyruvate reductase
MIYFLQWPGYNSSPFSFTGPQLSPIPPLPGAEQHIASPSLSTNNPETEKTVGFLGFGRIAQAVLARLSGFGVTKAVFTSNPASKADPSQEIGLAAKHRMRSLRRVDMKELAEESDFLVILAPGGPSTYHVVDEAFLRRMKKSAVLVNVARGTLVDSDALARALSEGWIYAAGIDVVEGEPNVGADHPLVTEPRYLCFALDGLNGRLTSPRCVVLPHIGSATTEARIGMTTLAVRNVLAVLDGTDMPTELTLKA